MIYSNSHQDLGKVEIKTIYPTKELMRKGYARDFGKLASNIKKSRRNSSDVDRVLSHLRFFGRKNREIGKLGDENTEAIIYSNITDPRKLSQSSKKSMIKTSTKKTSKETTEVVPSSALSISDLNLHIMYPLSDDPLDGEEALLEVCQFWAAYIQASGSRLVSCQQESITDRLYEQNIIPPPLPEIEVQSYLMSIVESLVQNKRRTPSMTSALVKSRKDGGASLSL